MKLVNLTPHPISLANQAGEIILTVPTSGTIARVSTEQVDTGFIVAGLPVVRNIMGSVTDLPEPVEGTFFIVSLFVLSAIVGRQDVVAPDTGSTCVRNSAGHIQAVRQLLAAEEV